MPFIGQVFDRLERIAPGGNVLTDVAGYLAPRDHNRQNGQQQYGYYSAPPYSYQYVSVFLLFLSLKSSFVEFVNFTMSVYSLSLTISRCCLFEANIKCL
jgi:hypothetical protein